MSEFLIALVVALVVGVLFASTSPQWWKWLRRRGIPHSLILVGVILVLIGITCPLWLDVFQPKVQNEFLDTTQREEDAEKTSVASPPKVPHLDTIPRPCFDPEILTFEVTSGVAPPSQSLKLWNCGEGTLNFVASTNSPWIRIDPTSGSTTREPCQISVAVDPRRFCPGEYHGSIEVVAGSISEQCEVVLRLPEPSFEDSGSHPDEPVVISHLPVIWEDSFSSSDAANWSKEGSSFSVGIENQRLRLVVKQEDQWYSVPFGCPRDDFCLDLDINFGQVTGESSGGVMFRQSQLHDYYKLYVQDDGRIRILKRMENRLEWLCPWMMPTVFRPTGYNHLRLVAVKSRFILHINERKVFEFVDDSLSSGDISVFAKNYEAAESWVSYDNIVVRVIPRGLLLDLKTSEEQRVEAARRIVATSIGGSIALWGYSQGDAAVGSIGSVFALAALLVPSNDYLLVE